MSSAREAAEKLVVEWQPQADVYLGDASHAALVTAIAAAILAERRRCSRVATDYGRDVLAGRMYADRIAGLIDEAAE